MYARWASFAIGLALMLAPLVLGYGSVARILHDVAMGALVCIATLSALEWPLARLVVVAPAVWLLLAGRAAPEAGAAVAELASGVLLLVLAAVPSAPFARRRAGARA